MAKKNSNKIKESKAYQVFTVFNNGLLLIIALLCLLPVINVFAQSLSHEIAIKAGKVFLLPMEFAQGATEELSQYYVGFNSKAYQYLLDNSSFWTAFQISVVRTVLGTIINLFFVISVAYPCSQSTEKFPARTLYIWFFFITMLFGGGMIASYFVITETGLLNTIWALIIPGAVPVYNIILMLNFFRQLPKELDEAAFMDGAGHWTVLFKIYIPTSLPSIATITLFTMVGHWNDWFAGMLYMNKPDKYPLQTYLQSLVAVDDVNKLKEIGLEGNDMRGVSNENLVAAQIFIGAAPILCVYPFLQKYFAKGIVLGSVKG